MNSGTALQGAIYATLAGSLELTTALGGTFIFDDVPDRQKLPYVLFGQSRHSDWSTSTEDGTEHEINLDIWSRENGRKQIFEFSDLITSSLGGLPETLSGHHLVNFKLRSLTISRDPKSTYYLGRLVFRAITEPV